MNGTISRQDFDKLDTDGKLGVIFETLQTREEQYDRRFGKLERRKWWDKGLAMITAAVVALATVFGISLRSGG